MRAIEATVSMKAKVFMRFVIAVSAMCVFCTLVGCIPSATLTEIFYGQDENYPLDLDAPKVYRSSPDAELSVEDVPEARLDESALANEESRDIPQYGEGESDQEIEQSDKKAGNTENKSPRETAGTEGERSDDSNDGGEGNQGKSKLASSDANKDEGKSGKTAKGGGKGNHSKNGGRKKNKKQEEPPPDSQVGVEPGRTFTDVGNNDDLPDNVRSVAAVGNAAVAVAVLGGEDGVQNLVAADADLLQGSLFSTVLAGKLSGSYEKSDISAPLALWDGDGSSESDLSAVNFDALVKLKPDACLVSEDEETISADQEHTLNEAGINVVYMPSMTSPEKIKACVVRAGILLERGGDTSASRLASEYVRFHDDVFGHYQVSSEDSIYTLYISDWETGVSYARDPRRAPWAGSPDNGVAVTRVGQSSQVPSDYLEAVGVINTARKKVRFSRQIGKALVWQVAGGTLLKEWSQAGYGAGVRGASVELSSDSGFTDSSLMCLVVGSTSYQLGDDLFSRIIVANHSVEKGINDDRGRANGLYACYDSTGSGAAGAIGTCITSPNYAVEVNPSGLFSSWADGSMESVLETAWACEYFRPEVCEPDYLRTQTEYFYRTFYGYNSSNFGDDYQAIMNATYADEG